MFAYLLSNNLDKTSIGGCGRDTFQQLILPAVMSYQMWEHVPWWPIETRHVCSFPTAHLLIVFEYLTHPPFFQRNSELWHPQQTLSSRPSRQTSSANYCIPVVAIELQLMLTNWAGNVSNYHSNEKRFVEHMVIITKSGNASEFSGHKIVESLSNEPIG